MLKKNFIRRKLKLIQDDLEKLAELKKYTLEEITSDFFRLATLERLFERIIIRAIDINEHLISELGSGREEIKGYRDTFLLLSDLKICPKKFSEEIAQCAGLRNAIVHEYDNLDLTLVYDSISQAVRQFLKYCSYVNEFIDRR